VVVGTLGCAIAGKVEPKKPVIVTTKARQSDKNFKRNNLCIDAQKKNYVNLDIKGRSADCKEMLSLRQFCGYFFVDILLLFVICYLLLDIRSTTKEKLSGFHERKMQVE
jgi:hypothetical protein